MLGDRQNRESKGTHAVKTAATIRTIRRGPHNANGFLADGDEKARPRDNVWGTTEIPWLDES